MNDDINKIPQSLTNKEIPKIARKRSEHIRLPAPTKNIRNESPLVGKNLRNPTYTSVSSSNLIKNRSHIKSVQLRNDKRVVTVTFEDKTHTNLLFGPFNIAEDILRKICKKRILNEKEHHLEKVDGTIIKLNTPMDDLSNQTHILFKSNDRKIEEEEKEDLFDLFDGNRNDYKKKSKGNLIEMDDDFFYDNETGIIDSKDNHPTENNDNNNNNESNKNEIKPKKTMKANSIPDNSFSSYKEYMSTSVPSTSSTTTSSRPTTKFFTTKREMDLISSIIDEEEKFVLDISVILITDIPKRVECKRDNIVFELLYTEQTYVKGLKVLKEFYCRQLLYYCTRNNWPVYIRDALKKVENMVDSILSINLVLLKNLEEKMSNWNSHTSTLGDVLLQLTPFLKVYTTYTADFDSVIEKVTRSEKYIPFAEKMNEIMQDPNVRDFLRSFFITPVQRIPRYILLLKDLVKSTPETHTDLLLLNQTLEKLEKVALEINEAVRNAENKSKCFQIQKSIIGGDFIIAPHRKILREGKLKKIKKKDIQVRMLWLFNDILLYCRSTNASERFATNKKYKKPQFVFLANAKVEHDNNPYSSEKNLKAFQVLTDRKSFVFATETEEECSMWIKAILTEILREQKNKNSFLSNSILDNNMITLQTNTNTNTNTNVMNKEDRNDGNDGNDGNEKKEEEKEEGISLVRNSYQTQKKIDNLMDSIDNNSVGSQGYKDGDFKFFDYNPEDSSAFYKPIWISDFKSEKCMTCSTNFSLILRRHHCRSCGILVCKDCSKDRVIIKQIAETPLRVCTTCSKKWNPGGELDMGEIKNISGDEENN